MHYTLHIHYYTLLLITWLLSTFWYHSDLLLPLGTSYNNDLHTTHYTLHTTHYTLNRYILYMTYFTKQSSTWSYTLHSQAWLTEMRDYPGPTSSPDLYLRQFDWAGLLVTSCFLGGQDYTVGRPSMRQVLWLAPLLFIDLGSRYRGRILDPMEEHVSSIKSWYSTWYSILGTCQALLSGMLVVLTVI